MNLPKLGVYVNDLGLGVKGGIKRASELELDGVQLAGDGELDIDNLSKSGRREVVKFVERHSLALGSLGAGVGRGLRDAEANNRIVPLVANCLAAARDLGTKIVTLNAGSVAEDEADPSRHAMREALADLEREAQLHGVVLALETGGEPPERLAAFLEALDFSAIRVNIDPGALVTRGWSPSEAVGRLAPWTVQTYARDGRFGGGESDLGKGEVEWHTYVAELAAIGYQGFQIIRCGAGRDRSGSAARAADFLRRL
jgi:sugar phosphate isomerase/epimerase